MRVRATTTFSVLTRKRLALPGGALAVGLAMLGAAAFACVPSGNSTAVIPNFGIANSALSVSTDSLGNTLARNFPGFLFRYASAPVASGGMCHISTSYGDPVTSDANGNIRLGLGQRHTRTITNLGGVGTGNACWATGVMVSTQVTDPAVITVNPN